MRKARRDALDGRLGTSFKGLLLMEEKLLRPSFPRHRKIAAAAVPNLESLPKGQ